MIDFDQPPSPVCALSLLLPALACGAESPVSDEPDATETSSSTDAGSSTSGFEGEISTSGIDSTGDAPSPSCGNEIVENGEACDDGEHNGTPGHCAADCQGPAIGCGDGLVQPDEACDDGNAVDGDGCNRDCRESGVVVWEHEDVRYGDARGLGVGTDGAIYLAGQVTGPWPAAWAARLDDSDGTVEWAYELPTPDDSSADSAFNTVTVLGEDEILWGGQHDDDGYLVELEANGRFVRAERLLAPSSIDRFFVLPDNGYLISDRWTAFRINGLFVEWQDDVGFDLAYRLEDDKALAAVDVGAGFQPFTLEGVVLEPVMFPLPEGVSAWSRKVAWTLTGDIVVAGRVQTSDLSAKEALVLRSSLAGGLNWMYGPHELQGQDREISCLAIDSQDAIIVGGWSSLLGELRPFLMKLSSDGELLWVRSLEFEATTAQALGCTTTATDEIIAVGRANDHIWFAKLTP